MLRFATSPTGDMQINDLRLALLNYLVAQQRGQEFLIRIDDGGTSQNLEGKDTEIMQILEKFAITHDTVYHQSEHLHMHQTLAIRLLEEGKAFLCTCTPEMIQKAREEAEQKAIPYYYAQTCEKRDHTAYKQLQENNTPFVLRLKKPQNPIIIQDTLQGDITITPDEVDSFIILHEDGTPSAIFASACDDIINNIEIVIQSDNFSHTAKQKHIKTQLGYTEATDSIHLPSLYHPNTIETVKLLFEEGFIPDAIINTLLLIGYTHPKQEIFTLPEAIKWFKLENLSPQTDTFDKERLRHINQAHLRRIEDKKLSTLFGFADKSIGKLAKLYLERYSTLQELEAVIRPIFTDKPFEGQWESEMRMIESIIQNAPLIDDFHTFEAYIIQKSGLTKQALQMPLRLLLTGSTQGPKLSDIYPFIKSYLLKVAS